MNHSSSSLVVKFASILAAAFVSFLLAERNFYGWILFLALVTAAFSYLIDRTSLADLGNIKTSLVDGFFAAFLALALSIAVPEFIAPPATLVLFGALVSLTEHLVHLMVKKQSRL
jgi:glucan phosphoethanolaminetransferase (alkaline phosphatase superfamily)